MNSEPETRHAACVYVCVRIPCCCAICLQILLPYLFKLFRSAQFLSCACTHTRTRKHTHPTATCAPNALKNIAVNALKHIVAALFLPYAVFSREGLDLPPDILRCLLEMCKRRWCLPKAEAASSRQTWHESTSTRSQILPRARALSCADVPLQPRSGYLSDAGEGAYHRRAARRGGGGGSGGGKSGAVSARDLARALPKKI